MLSSSFYSLRRCEASFLPLLSSSEGYYISTWLKAGLTDLGARAKVAASTKVE